MIEHLSLFDEYLHIGRHRNLELEDDRLVRNSFFLIAAISATAFFGAGFALVVARVFPPEQVGLGTSLISATMLIAFFSLFGLNGTMVRFIANSQNSNGQITQSLFVVGGLGLLMSSTYVILVPLYAPALSFVRDNSLYALGFIIAGALAGITLLTDSVFIGARRPEYNLLAEGLVQGTIKLVLPAAMIGLGAYGVFASVGGGYLVAVVVSVLCMRYVLGFRFNFRRKAAITKEQLRYSFSSYIANALNILPMTALPLMTLHILGPAQTAYFYLAFQVAAALYGISYAIGQAMFAEGSSDQSHLVNLSKRAGLMLATLQLPALIVVALGSPANPLCFRPTVRRTWTASAANLGRCSDRRCAKYVGRTPTEDSSADEKPHCIQNGLCRCDDWTRAAMGSSWSGVVRLGMARRTTCVRDLCRDCSSRLPLAYRARQASPDVDLRMLTNTPRTGPMNIAE